MASSYVPDSIPALHSAIARDLYQMSDLHTLDFVFLKKVACGCTTDPIGQKPPNQWVTGTAMPFSQICDQCNGTGFRMDEVVTTTKAFIYFTPKDWLKIDAVLMLESTDGIIQTRTLIESLKDIESCDYIKIADSDYGTQKYKLKGKPVLHGMLKFNETICMWQRMT